LNYFIYIGVLIFLLGWMGLLIIGLFFRFEDDEQDKPYPCHLSIDQPHNPSDAFTPESSCFKDVRKAK